MNQPQHVFLRLRVSDHERGRWLQGLSKALPSVVWHGESDLPPSVANQIHVAVVANPEPGCLQGLPNLAFIQSLWAGVDSLLADPSIPSHLVIARMVDPAMTQMMAQTALWATLSLHRGFFDYAEQQRARIWRPLQQRSAETIRVVVLGAGAMGKASAQAIAAQGYLVQTIGSSDQGLLDAAIGAADIVINLLPLTKVTRGILNHGFFAALPKGAAIVNLGRGGHLIEEDLLTALNSGQLSHAVLDVFQTEPLPNDHPFWNHGKVTVLPHAAAITDPESASQVVANQLQAWFAGRPVMHLIDRQRGY